MAAAKEVRDCNSGALVRLDVGDNAPHTVEALTAARTVQLLLLGMVLSSGEYWGLV